MTPGPGRTQAKVSRAHKSSSQVTTRCWNTRSELSKVIFNFFKLPLMCMADKHSDYVEAVGLMNAFTFFRITLMMKVGNVSLVQCL